ncbi:hypothetical protein NSED_05950 [Candidatus Nitrosopumilus sediminis]|uniref:Uncharacterized protein n=2 Tax=Candidatus Nitrosopumilus sediminis TaxID=1229909 RepID=K0BD54_9ARCH|nr:hypothetical protein NSED_05950 [Candidatus Nitrosopumilus sediminis]
MLLFAFSILFPITEIFAPPGPNEWSRAPYCPAGCSLDFMKQRWSEYYNYKGSEWMELKKQEMLLSINNGTIEDWLNTDPSRAHYNVFNYYFYAGEIPNLEGKFIDQVKQDMFFSDMKQNLNNNQFPLGNHTYINFSLMLAGVTSIAVVITFILWKKRK